MSRHSVLNIWNLEAIGPTAEVEWRLLTSLFCSRHVPTFGLL